MSREADAWLEDMEEACRQISEWTAGLSLDQFESDDILLNAVLRQLQILGEAAKQVPPELQQSAPDVPWNTLARFRDVLVHYYFGIEVSIIWATVNDRVPELLDRIVALRRTLRDERF